MSVTLIIALIVHFLQSSCGLLSAASNSFLKQVAAPASELEVNQVLTFDESLPLIHVSHEWFVVVFLALLCSKISTFFWTRLENQNRNKQIISLKYFQLIIAIVNHSQLANCKPSTTVKTFGKSNQAQCQKHIAIVRLHNLL